MSDIKKFLKNKLEIKEAPPKDSEADILTFLEKNYIDLFDECD